MECLLGTLLESHGVPKMWQNKVKSAAIQATPGFDRSASRRMNRKDAKDAKNIAYNSSGRITSSTLLVILPD